MDESRNEAPYYLGYRFSSLIFLLLNIIEIILAFRFILKLFAANTENAFVGFVYRISNPLVAPFQGIFRPITQEGSVVEWATLLAMVVYVVVAYLIARLIRIILSA